MQSLQQAVESGEAGVTAEDVVEPLAEVGAPPGVGVLRVPGQDFISSRIMRDSPLTSSLIVITACKGVIVSSSMFDSGCSALMAV